MEYRLSKVKSKLVVVIHLLSVRYNVYLDRCCNFDVVEDIQHKILTASYDSTNKANLKGIKV